MTRIAAFVLVAMLPAAGAAAEVAVELRWEYQNLPPAMKIYHQRSQSPAPLWQTASRAKGELLPVGREIGDARLRLQPGQRKRFVLVYANPTDKPLYFFAAPHQAAPAEHSLGFHLKCLCVGEAFKVGPGETWYRVVELQLSKGFEGDALVLTHTLIGIDAPRAARFGQKSGD
jgi:hypothetical protein